MRVTMNADTLSALSTLVAFSHESEDVCEARGEPLTAKAIRESRALLRVVLYRTGTWSQVKNFAL